MLHCVRHQSYPYLPARERKVPPMKRQLLALLLALTMVLTTGVAASAASLSDKDEITYTNAPQVFTWVYKNYTDNTVGSISITQGTINYNHDVAGYDTPVEEHVPVYVVAIAGTEATNGMDNNAMTDIFVGGFNWVSDYEKEVKAAIYKAVPKGSNLYITGHSLGGMTAQQLAGDPDLKKDYHILFTLAFGSPIQAPFQTEGVVVRLNDKYDWVRYVSINSLLSLGDPLGLMTDEGVETNYSAKELIEYYNKLSEEESVKDMAALFGDSSEKKDPAKPGEVEDAIWYVHDTSYASEKTWGQYDATGRTSYDITLTLYPKTTQYFHGSLTEYQ